jgi:hypothetical protein
MDFGKVLTRSWEIIWKHKALWIFGILASCSGNFNIGGNFSYRADRRDIGNLPPNFQRFFTGWERNFEQFFNERNIGWIIAIVCIAILIGILFWALGIFGKVGLIKGAINAEAGKAFGFRSLARESWALLGKAVGLSILLFLLPFAVVLLLFLMGAALAAATLGIALICLIPLACLLVPIFLLYILYTEMAMISLIKESLSVGEALSRGWEVFRSHLGNLIGMGLILFVGGLLVGLILAIPTVALFAPAFFGLMSDNPDALGNGLLTSVILFLIALPFLILINGIVRGYIQSAWTLTYMQLTGVKPRASRAKARA